MSRRLNARQQALLPRLLDLVLGPRDAMRIDEDAVWDVIIKMREEGG